MHPRYVGRCGLLDHTIKDLCITEDRVIVSANISDFRALLGKEVIHPGFIALPQTSPALGLALVENAIALLVSLGRDPMDAIVNAMVIFEDGEPRLRRLGGR